MFVDTTVVFCKVYLLLRTQRRWKCLKWQVWAGNVIFGTLLVTMSKTYSYIHTHIDTEKLLLTRSF